MERFARAAILGAANERSYNRATDHAVAERRWVRREGSDHVARGNLDALHVDWVLAVKAEAVQQLQRLNEVGAERVLKRDHVGLHAAWQLNHLFMLNIDAHDRTNALREDEVLWLTEWLAHLDLPVAPDDRWVQTLFNNCPEAEDGRKRVALNAQVATVAHVHCRDVVKGPLLRVGGEDVGEAWIHPHANEGQLAAIFPELLALLLMRAEH